MALTINLWFSSTALPVIWALHASPNAITTFSLSHQFWNPSTISFIRFSNTALSLVTLSHFNKQCSASSTSPEPHCAQIRSSYLLGTTLSYAIPPPGARRPQYIQHILNDNMFCKSVWLFIRQWLFTRDAVTGQQPWPALKLCIFDYHEMTVVITSPFCSIL